MKLDRATAIRQHLFSRGYSSIGDIAEAVGASEPTIRRDLVLLAADGAIIRSHGGARIAEQSGAEIAFESRAQINLPAKRAIAEAAFCLLRPDTSVFLDAGTTVLQLARRLRLNPMPLRIFTNCLPVAQVLMPVGGLSGGGPSGGGLSVTLLGGLLRPQNSSMVGLLAEAALERLWFDHLFLGAGSIAADAGIYSADAQEAAINRKMLGRCNRPVLLADSDKFGQPLTYLVAPIQPAMHVICDDRLSRDWQDRLAATGAALTLAAVS